MKWFFLLFLALIALPVQAAELDYSRFARLPMLEDGRVKPLQSFATHNLVRLAGATQLSDMSATQWLATSLFDPSRAVDIPCFKIANAHVRGMLELSERSSKLYTLGDVLPGLVKAGHITEALYKQMDATLTVDERALLELQNNVIIYNQLLQSLSAILPLPQTAPAQLQLPAAPTYLDAQKMEAQLTESVSSFKPEHMNAEQEALASFALGLQKLREAGSNNVLLRIMPATWNASSEWLAPWQLLLSGQGSPESTAQIESWQKMANAFRANDAASWHSATVALDSATPADLHHRLLAEVWLNRLRPLDMAALLFVLAGALAVGKRLRPATYVHLAAAVALAATLAARIYILQRPPVGTLYESILFVALIVAMGLRSKVLLASSSAFFLMLVASGLQGSGDSLGMLTAVLNTNFWLTIHVLCITAGYGACLITALWAHVLVWRAGSQSITTQIPFLLRLSLIALLLTATGTLLGGVWADQSWGRFWGWDPKENGALIIVLWLIWLQHGRLAGQFTPILFSTGLACLGVVVALAWFGVNLLGTGLHSYGFITGIAASLFAFTALSLSVITALYLRARKYSHAA